MTGAPFKNLDVLIIDDEQALLDLLKKYLLEFGYRPTAVSSAEKALELFESKRFNLVVSDIRMGKMSGLELAQKLRERFSSLAIIFITGKPNSQGLDVAKSVGATQYIVKPVVKSEFADALAIAARWNMAQLIGRVAEKYFEIRGGRMGSADGKFQRIKTEVKNILMNEADSQLLTEFAYSKNTNKTRLFTMLDEKLAELLRTI